MIRKFIPIFLSATLGMLWISAPSFSQTTTSTTTVDSTTTKTAVVPVKKAPVHRRTTTVTKPVQESTSVTSTTTTVVPPPPPPQKEVVHKVYDEEMLKKMQNTLCGQGFKAYVGLDKKNVCSNQATAPDIAYSCVWDKKGAAAFEPTEQGPCSLDYTVHKGSVTIKKELYKDNPPLDYGKEAQCCFRAAKSLETATK